MDSLLIHFQSDKKELLLALLKEFSFIKEVEVIDHGLKSHYEKTINESEEDIESGKLTSQKDIEKEILKWRKK